MFNLDQAIAEWRRKLAAAGLKARDVLDELESHLREDVERRFRSGSEISQAFQIAVAHMGAPQSLKVEFAKVRNEERKYMKRGLIISAGIIGILLGMAFVMPAVAQYNHEGAMKKGEPWLFLLGSLMTLAGFAAAIRSLKKSRA